MALPDWSPVLAPSSQHGQHSHDGQHGHDPGTNSDRLDRENAALRELVTVYRYLSGLALQDADLAGVVNLDDRSATMSAFSASWRNIDTRLLGPASIATRPGIVVRHLVLGLNGGRIGLDGQLTPQLAATLNVQDLPANTARFFAPDINATGMLSATATIMGMTML